MALLLCLFVTEAYARWKPQYADADPAIQTWFATQHNANGEWCCDKSDGHPFYDDYKINEDGSVTLHRDGVKRTLPAYMVLKGSNPVGHAVYWFVGDKDYCFAPGSLT